MSPTPVSTVRPDTGARRAWWLGGLLTGVLALASLAVGSTGMEKPIVQVGSQLAQLIYAQMRALPCPTTPLAGWRCGWLGHFGADSVGHPGRQHDDPDADPDAVRAP